MTSSITTHDAWPLVKPWIKIQRYGRDPGVHGARVRIEIVVRPRDADIERQLLALTMPCVACEREMHPIRERHGRPGLYYAATCPLDVSMPCSRGAAARDEYERVKKAVEP